MNNKHSKPTEGAQIVKQELLNTSEKVALNYILNQDIEQVESVSLSVFSGLSQEILKAAKRLRAKGKEVNILSLAEELNSENPKLLERVIETGNYTEGATTEETYRIALANLERAYIESLIEGKLNTIKGDRLTTISEITEGLRLFLDDIDRGYSNPYERYLIEDTDKLLESYRQTPKGIKTNILLSNRDGGDSFRFTLPSGAITAIGAPTGHGKSKMLQSVALDCINDDPESILYLTYEENRKNVIKQFLNAYVDIELTRQSGKHGEKHGNLETITEYLYNGDTKFMRAEAIPEFKTGVEKFWGLLRSQRLRVVKPEDNYLSTLLSLLRYFLRKTKLKAIFIDYIQELYIEDSRKNLARADELKEIMINIDLLAQEFDIPIVVAAQLNRETDSPLTMSNQSISDSGWIERKSSEILLIWSNKEKCKNDIDGKKTERANREIPGLDLGTQGKLYTLLSKSRLAISGLNTILQINGNTGRVKGNYKAPEPTEGELVSEKDEEEMPF